MNTLRAVEPDALTCPGCGKVPPDRYGPYGPYGVLGVLAPGRTTPTRARSRRASPDSRSSRWRSSPPSRRRALRRWSARENGVAFIPEGGDVMYYGDGGAGKTTLAFDLAFHLAAGEDWLGIAVAAPGPGVADRERGPAPAAPSQAQRKAEAWAGGEVGDRLRVFEQPVGEFAGRGGLARTASSHRRGARD